MRQGLSLGVQSAQNLASGGVSMSVQDAVTAVCTFAAEGELGAVSVEFRAPLNQFFNAIGSFLDENLRGLGIAKAIPSRKGVLQVQADLVFVAQSSRNSTLCPVCIGISDLLLCENYD